MDKTIHHTEGFNTLDKLHDDIVTFCEHMEECKQLDGDLYTKTAKKPSAQSGKRESSDRYDLTSCMLHGKDKGHDNFPNARFLWPKLSACMACMILVIKPIV